MIPKDKGWGMSNLGLWGKNPCVATLFCLPPSLVSSNLFNVLTLLAEGSYCMRRRGHGKTWVLAGCCQSGQYACLVENIHFSHAGLHSFPWSVSLTLPWPIHSHVEAMVGGSSCSVAHPHAQEVHSHVEKFRLPHPHAIGLFVHLRVLVELLILPSKLALSSSRTSRGYS